MSLSEAANALRYSYRHTRELLRQGDLPAKDSTPQKKRRTWRVDAAAVRAMKEARGRC